MHEKSINERCLVLLKSDCVKRKLIGTLIARIEAANLAVVALHMLIPTESLIGKHYKEDKEWLRTAGQKKIDHYKEKGIEIKDLAMDIGHQIRNNLIHSMAGKKVVAMVIQGPNSVRFLRKLAGATEPLSAEPGTIRGSYSSDSYEIADIETRTIQNLIHVSDSFETAKKEIEMWFPEGLYEKQD